MLSMMPLTVFTGISIAFWAGMISPIIVLQIESDPKYDHKNMTENQKFALSLEAMVAFGVAEVIGSYVHGYIADKFTSKRATLFLILTMILMTFATLYAIMSHQYGISSYMMTFFFGFQDAALNVQMF